MPPTLPGASVLPELTVTAGVMVPVPLSVPPVLLKLMPFVSAVAEL